MSFPFWYLVFVLLALGGSSFWGEVQLLSAACTITMLQA